MHTGYGEEDDREAIESRRLGSLLSRGDWAVYLGPRHSSSPGSRAKEVAAAPRGDSYSYFVDKFRVVKQLLDDMRVLRVTRTGKQHVIALSDPKLRPARWWERWMHGDRFRQTEKALQE